MSRASEALAGLPDDALVPVRWVKKLLAGEVVPSEFRVLTTREAADLFGYSVDTWRGWADEGEVRGAYRDEGEAGTWRLPMKACEEHLARLQSGALNRRRKRGPWQPKARTSAQAPQAGAEADPERKVVRLRPSPVGRRPADDATPESPRLA
jgi:hypothetical protein